jgi:hypothetical protein
MISISTYAQVYYPFPFPPTDKAAKGSTNDADFTWAVCVDVCPNQVAGEIKNYLRCGFKMGLP